MKTKSQNADDGGSCPLWMMTFGDCMSLLVTFFVLLIAFTNTETERLLEMLGGLKGALGIIEDPNRLEEVSASETRISGSSSEPKWLSLNQISEILPDARMAVKRFGKPSIGGVDRHLLVEMLDEGLVFIVNAFPLFEEEKAKLLPESHAMLDRIAKFVSSFENEVQIAAVVPGPESSSRSRGAGEGLAIARAMAVRNRMCRVPGLDADRFAVGARVTLGGDEGPAQFAQRIEILLLGRRSFENLSPEEIIVRDRWY